MEQTHLDAGEWHRHENIQMHRNYTRWINYEFSRCCYIAAEQEHK